MVRRRQLIPIAVTIFIALMLFGCSAKPADTTPTSSAAPVQLTGADSGKTTGLVVGQGIVITLESNASTGYSWIAKPVPSVLEQAAKPVYTAPDPTVGTTGAPGTQTFTYRGASAGTGALTLEYRRKWEVGVAPAQTFTVNVEVQ